MRATNKKCPFRKLERESSIYKHDEEFQYCLGKECMACLTIEDGCEVCGLIMKPILHQEVDFFSE